MTSNLNMENDRPDLPGSLSGTTQHSDASTPMEWDTEIDIEKEKMEPLDLNHLDSSRLHPVHNAFGNTGHSEKTTTEEPAAMEAEKEKETLDQLPTTTFAPTPSSSDSEPPSSRPVRPAFDTRATTQRSVARSLPPLKKKETRMMQKQAHPMEHLGITLGLPMILLFDITIPCIIYYTWYNSHKSTWERTCRDQYTSRGEACPLEKPEFDKDILGYAIICFGFGELWILIARVWRLFFRQEECAPLLSRSKWELDATSWVYGVAMILALIPFVVGSSLVMPHLYLYSPSCLMGFLGLLMVVTTVYPFKIPIGINSQARGSRLRPFIYYAAEDFIAVDGLQDREFRVRYNERYETNKAFRRMFYYLTLWWLLGVCVYIGAVSAVIWTLPFHIAFGLSLGVLFAYIACWAGVSYAWVKYEIARQHRVFEKEQAELDA